MAKTGRPSDYTLEKAAYICEQLAMGRSLRAICAEERQPDQVTVFRWIANNDEFRKQYARARELQAETMADDILEIADDGSRDSYEDDEGKVRVDHDVVARSRLRVDARKWLASKLLPKKYGEKVGHEVGGVDGGPVKLIVEWAKSSES